MRSDGPVIDVIPAPPAARATPQYLAVYYPTYQPPVYGAGAGRAPVQELPDFGPLSTLPISEPEMIINPTPTLSNVEGLVTASIAVRPLRVW